MATTDAASLSTPVIGGSARSSVKQKIKIRGNRLRRSPIIFWGTPHSPHCWSDRFQADIGLNNNIFIRKLLLYVWNSLSVEEKAITNQ